MDNISSQNSTNPIKKSKSHYFLFIIPAAIAILILLGILTFKSLLTQSNKTSSIPAPTSSKKSLKIPGFQLVAEGKVIDKKTDYLLIEEGESMRTKINAKSETAVSIHNVSDASDKSTLSGVLVSVLVSKETGSYEKISIGDKVRILLDESNNQLFAESITVFREIKY